MSTNGNFKAGAEVGNRASQSENKFSHAYTMTSKDKTNHTYMILICIALNGFYFLLTFVAQFHCYC